MPTFRGSCTTVQLSVANLARATSPNPLNKQCVESAKSIENIALEFYKGSEDGTLAEKCLNSKDGRHLWHLGRHKDMPFFLVHAGSNFFDLESTERRNRRSAWTMEEHEATSTQKSKSVNIQMSARKMFLRIKTSPDNSPFKVLSQEPNRIHTPPPVPHALSLTVFLTKRSFTHIFYEKSQKKMIQIDIKIDVYFNGQLCESKVVPNYHRDGDGLRGTKGRNVRFAGYKLNRFLEKPWVFVPPGQTSDEKSRHFHKGCIEGSSSPNIERWRALSDALLAEADCAGRNEYGGRPVIGEYLESLASLPIPSEVEDMHRSSGVSFGVIDVVVIWGHGKQDAKESKYILEPTRTRLPDSSTSNIILTKTNNVETLSENLTISELKSNSESSAPSNIAATSENLQAHHEDLKTSSLSPSSPPKTRSEALPSSLPLGYSSSQPPKPANPSIIERVPPPHRPRCESSTKVPTRPTSISSSKLPSPAPTPKRSREPSLPTLPENPAKRRNSTFSRRRMHYHNVVTTKLTSEENYESIVEQAVEDAESRLKSTHHSFFRTTRASLANVTTTGTLNSSPLSSLPTEEENVGNGIREIHETMTGKVRIVSLRIPKRLRAKVAACEKGEYDTLRCHPPVSGAVSVSAMARGSNSVLASPLGTETFDADFVLPDLSQDCCITYAGRDVVRNVRGVRGGWFKERGVVMGTRFIVG